MSFSGHAVLALHIAAVAFAIGPGTAAIMSTPRYIRKGNVVIVRHLYRTTRVYSAATILVLVFGIILAQIQHDFAKWWVSVSITLFVVAAVLLVLIMRDQAKAITALDALASPGGTEGGASAVPASPAASAGTTAEVAPGKEASPDEGAGAGDGTVRSDKSGGTVLSSAEAARIAAVERGRIASLSGIVGLIWLASLVIMVFK